MKIHSITWASRFDNCKVPAKVAYDAIEEIRDENDGRVTAELLVAKSRPADHPLHPIIHKLSNAQAAQQHRLTVARTCLRSLEVRYEGRPKVPGRMYNVIHEAKHGEEDEEKRTAYSTTEEILQDPAAKDRLIMNAIKQIRTWQRRYHYLRELEQIFNAIETVENGLSE